VVGLHWLLVSSHAPWWGGYGYGARLMTEVVPWLVLLGTLGWAAVPETERPRRRIGAALAAALVGVGIVLNGIGAISRSAVVFFFDIDFDLILIDRDVFTYHFQYFSLQSR
jgi:hypothetical protein